MFILFLTFSVTRLPFCTILPPPFLFYLENKFFIDIQRAVHTVTCKHFETNTSTHIYTGKQKRSTDRKTLFSATRQKLSTIPLKHTHSKVKVRGCGVISGPLVHCQWPINKTAHGSYGYYCIAGSPLAIARSGYGLLMIHLGWVCTDWSSALYWWQTIESI